MSGEAENHTLWDTARAKARKNQSLGIEMSEDKKDFPLLHVYSQATARSPLKIAANTTGLRALIDTVVAAVVEEEAKTELFCNDAEAYELTVRCDDSNQVWDSWQLPYPQESSIEERSRVKVSHKLLEKASRLFNATLTDIFNELLQNSRRSGASRVEIASVELESGNWVELVDDGSGIFKDGVAIVLGQSGWDEAIRESEDPAGMGIFALAHRGAILESNGCRLALSEAQFCGRESYAIESSDRTCGTKISFGLLPTEIGRVETVVQECSRYYPLPVALNGKEIELQEFLADIDYCHEWHGLRIGVTSAYRGDKINFYGLVIERELPKVSEVDTNIPYAVKIEVADAPELKLVLPARKEVVENEFFEEVKQACYRAIYCYIATKESHVLSFKHWSRAINLGIALPPAAMRLKRYEPERADGNQGWWQSESVESNNAIAIAAILTAAEAQVFWRGWERAGLPYTLYRAEPKFQGYPWYDALPKLTAVSLVAEVDGKRELVEAEAKFERTGRVDRLWVICTTEANGRCERFEFETDVAFWSDEPDCTNDLYQITVLLNKNTDISAWELSELLEAAYFSPCDDVDVDSYDTQQENFQLEAQQLALQLLFSEDEALVERLRSEVERHLRWLLPYNRTAQISIDRSINIQLGDVSEAKIVSH